MRLRRGVILLTAMAVAQSVWAQDAVSVVIPIFERAWGEFGSGPGQFYDPRGVAVASDGSVYVTDLGNSRVQKFTADGVFVMQWGTYGSASGQFRAATGIAVDAQGYVYVTDMLNSRVEKFTSDGQFVLTWGEPGFGPGQFGWWPPPSAQTGPWGVAVAPDGTVYVTDPGANRVQQFTALGEYIAEFSAYGPGTELDEAHGLGFDLFGNVFVTDPSVNNVVKFTVGGEFETYWGDYGCCEGRFRGPEDLDVDVQGNVFVTDGGNEQIQVFDNAGQFLARWFLEPPSPGPVSIAFGPAGALYIADENNNRILKYVSPTAVQPTTWGAIKDLYR